MNQQENIKTVQLAYDHFQRGNIPSVLATLADNVEWQLPEMTGIPFSGTRKGREQVREFFSSLARLQDPLEFEPKEYLADRDKVVVQGHYGWRVKSTGRIFESDFVHVFTFQNGTVVRFQEYADTAAATRAHQEPVQHREEILARQ